ncbi:MAG: hypothetical protein GX838_03540 [Clostridiaceae bacterium]|nr:hypothetical protein [Clostridiaceae bacterium]
MNREANLGRRLAVYGSGFIFLALLQLMLSLDSSYPTPDFLLLFPLLAALWTPGYDSFILGLAAGFIRDYAAGRGYGPGMLLGMVLCLCGNALARVGWKNYAVRGSLLIAGATVVQALTMAVFAWLVPLDQSSSTFSTAIRIALSQVPLQLLANVGGALLVSGYFWLCFFHKADRRGGAGFDNEDKGGGS